MMETTTNPGLNLSTIKEEKPALLDPCKPHLHVTTLGLQCTLHTHLTRNQKSFRFRLNISVEECQATPEQVDHQFPYWSLLKILWLNGFEVKCLVVLASFRIRTLPELMLFFSWKDLLFSRLQSWKAQLSDSIKKPHF